MVPRHSEHNSAKWKSCRIWTSSPAPCPRKKGDPVKLLKRHLLQKNSVTEKATRWFIFGGQVNVSFWSSTSGYVAAFRRSDATPQCRKRTFFAQLTVGQSFGRTVTEGLSVSVFLSGTEGGSRGSKGKVKISTLLVYLYFRRKFVCWSKYKLYSTRRNKHLFPKLLHENIIQVLSYKCINLFSLINCHIKRYQHELQNFSPEKK